MDKQGLETMVTNELQERRAACRHEAWVSIALLAAILVVLAVLLSGCQGSLR